MVSAGLLVGLSGTLPAAADTQSNATGANRVSAAPSATITTAPLNLRRGPGLSYGVHKVIPRGTRVYPTGRSARGFAEITVGSSRGWVSGRYLASSARRTAAASGVPRVTGSRYATRTLRIRSTSATKKFKVVAVVPRGTRLSITGVRKNGRSQVRYANAARWVLTKYLSRSRPAAAAAAPAASSYAVEKRLTANTIRVHRAARRAFPWVKTYHGYRNDPGSDHYRGRGLDLMIPNYRSAASRARGNQVANWARSNSRQLRIQYVIWNQHIWNVSRAGEGWRRMASRGNDSANHKNHVHISVR